MKLFDFKFLILLALALVVYFMYRELESQRDRVSYCEEKIKQILQNKEKNILENCDEHNQQNNSKIEDNTNTNKNQLTFEKPLNLVLPTKTLMKPDSIEESSSTVTSDFNQNRVVKNKNNDEKLRDSENKIVEIYSNDNDNVQETTISDSLVSNKKDILNKQLNLTKEITSIIDSFNESDSDNDLGNDEDNQSDTDEGNQSDMDEDKQSYSEDNESDSNEDNQNDSEEDNQSNSEEDNQNDSEEDNQSDSEDSSLGGLENDDSEKVKTKSNEDTSDEEPLDLENLKNQMKLNSQLIMQSSEESKTESDNNLELEKVLKDLNNEIDEQETNNEVKERKYDVKQLTEMKIKELQELIKKENLSLDKKINGVSKKKTKQELIEELSKI